MPKKYKSNIILLVILLILVIIFSNTSTYFLKWYNFKNILDQSTINIIVGIGMTFVICTAGIDLSVGSIAAFCGVVAALSMHAGIPISLSMIAAVLIGALAGFVNGYITSVIKVNPFIVTIATMSIWRALTLIFTKSTPIYGFPSSFTILGTGSFRAIPLTVVVCIIVIVLGGTLFNKTKLGYYSAAIGNNEEALRRTGISINYYKIMIYVLSGMTAAIAGLIITSKLNCADPTAGNMLEMDVIATVILGGTSINGGKGTIIGTVIAGLFMSVLKNGLTINAIPPYYQQLVVGLIIIFAVITSDKFFKE